MNLKKPKRHRPQNDRQDDRAIRNEAELESSSSLLIDKDMTYEDYRLAPPLP
jgi:hypothetical protein